MVKFTYTEDGSDRRNLGIGISRENVDKLIAGLPMVVKLPELGVTVDGNVLIYFGETSKDCVEQVMEFITRATLIHEEKPNEG